MQVLLNRYGDVRVRPDMFQVSLGQGKVPGPLKCLLRVTVLPVPNWLAQELGLGSAVHGVAEDGRVRGTLTPSCMLAEGFSVREHYLSSYRAAFVSILKAQLMPLRGMNGGEAAVRAFAADRHMNALCKYLGAYACWRHPHRSVLLQNNGHWSWRPQQALPC